MTQRIDLSSEPQEHIQVSLAGRTWDIARLADLETLWDQIGADEFGDDERMPYWAEIWPASLSLGKWLEEHRAEISGKRCLDMGCGLGLTALAGTHLGARVVGLDYEWAALHYAAINSRDNASPDTGWVQMDWRWPGFRQGVFDLVWGADIMYEKRFVEPVSTFLGHILSPGGKVFIAEPNRSVYEPFVNHIKEMGWSCVKARVERVMPVTTGPVAVTVNLWVLEPPTAGR